MDVLLRKDVSERMAGMREWRDGSGAAWSYVVLAGKGVRIERCDAHCLQLVVPAFIEGLPVVALAADACSYLPSIEEIRCPDSIVSIGFCAFRGDVNLRKAVLSAGLVTFDSDWFRGCSKIDHLVLSGRVPRLDASIFDVPQLRTLTVGPGTEGVEPGAFAKSSLETIEIDRGNPFLMTDGRGVYSRDGSVLVALAVPGRAYEIRPGCRSVSKKGFSAFSCIEHITVPDSLEVLEEFALSRTGIVEFVSPPSLRRIGGKAFFNCAHLRRVSLNEGLVSVGSNAFSGTDIRELRMPASIEVLGNPLAAMTALTYSGEGATFSLSPDSAHLELDDAGGLYRKEAGGLRLIRLMDPDARTYAAKRGTVAVGQEAFANQGTIAEVVLPDGVTDIEKAAFRACRALVSVEVPSSVRRIAEDAFLDTGLTGLRLPSGLGHLGTNALVTQGAHHGTGKSSLRDVSVGPGNERFYTVPGLLLERTRDGNARVILCTGTSDVIDIPAEVNEIMPYAFSGVCGIRELHLSDRIQKIGTRGLAVGCLIGRIRVHVEKPIAGREWLDIDFPDTDRGMQQMTLALGMSGKVDVAALFEHYDNAVINRSAFDVRNVGGLDLYEQATRIVARLRDPLLLTPVNCSMYDRILKNNVEKMCVAAARHDDRKVIDAMLDLGYLNQDNLYRVIDRVSSLQDAAMMGHLLEAKRLRFGQDSVDFGL